MQRNLVSLSSHLLILLEHMLASKLKNLVRCVKYFSILSIISAVGFAHSIYWIATVVRLR